MNAAPPSLAPPGWGHNPSEWPRRLPVLLLALAGCGIATYLTLYQVGVVGQVWEPFFGTGSKAILKESAVARLLPVPDAALGAFAYLVEAAAVAVGGRDRWRTRPWAVLLTGLVACALGLAGVLLVLLQAFVFDHFCTLCLASAACSVLTVWPAGDEALAGLRYLRQAPHQGRSAWRALWGM